MTDMGTRLKAMREAAGYTSQREFAKALGMSHSHVNKVEKGQVGISIPTMYQWAQLCGQSVALEFLGRESRDETTLSVLAEAVAQLDTQDRAKLINYAEFLRTCPIEKRELMDSLIDSIIQGA